MPVVPNRLLDLEAGIGQIQSRVVYRVLDRELRQIGTVNPLKAASVSANAAGSTKRTMSGFMVGEKTASDLDMFSDRIQPVWELEDGTQWPMGVFVFSGRATSEGSYVSTVGASLADQDLILVQETRASFGVPPRGSIVAAMNQILDDVGIFERDLPTTGENVGDPLTWPPATSRMEILKLLCKIGGWLPPYFDNRGVCVVKTPPVLAGDPDHRYLTRRISNGSPVENDNLLDAPNVFRVIGVGPSKAEIAAEAEVDPSLPFSVQSRGFEIVSTFRTQGLTSTVQAQQMANSLALGAARGFMEVTFDGPPDPRHDLFQTVSYGPTRTTYRESSWGVALTPGATHSHQLTLGGFVDG